MNKDTLTTIIGIITMIIGIGAVIALVLDFIDSKELGIIGATTLSLGTGANGYFTNKK